MSAYIVAVLHAIVKAILRLLSHMVAAGANPVQITRGIEKTAKALVNELQKMSKEVSSYYHLILLLTLVFFFSFLLALNNHINTTQPYLASGYLMTLRTVPITVHNLQIRWYHKPDIFCY